MLIMLIMLIMLHPIIRFLEKPPLIKLNQAIKAPLQLSRKILWTGHEVASIHYLL